MIKNSLSLYIHIPFCRHRCAYCDFNTYTSLGALQSEYATAVANEIAQVAGQTQRAAHTVFFGGGTPSLMSSADLKKILDSARQNFTFAAHSEISMEANPNTVSQEYLSAVRELGINRLSFGVQSVIPSELALLERQHDFETVIDAVSMARSAGFDNFNLDLIYGVPGQTMDSWRQSVQAILDLKPTHVSLYCLIIEPGTPMQRWLKQGLMPEPDGDFSAEQYTLAMQMMADHGFEHYEISNWSLPGKQCEHNLTYWRNGDYLGLGAGSHGHAAQTRYHVVKQPRVYMRRIAEQSGSYPWSGAVADKHPVTREDQIADTIITQLRLLQEGIDDAWFTETFGLSLTAHYGDTLTQLIDWELLHFQKGRLLLTKKGAFLSNQVFRRLI